MHGESESPCTRSTAEWCVLHSSVSVVVPERGRLEHLIIGRGDAVAVSDRLLLEGTLCSLAAVRAMARIDLRWCSRVLNTFQVALQMQA